MELIVRNIQAHLVLALSEFLNNAGSSHWMYAGIAIRMAQVMRLQKQYHQKHSAKEQEIRRRTLWACLGFDRLLAYFLTKVYTIPLSSITVALPSTDASVAYQEASRGLTLDSLISFDGYPSEIGLMPYLIKTMSLWSEIADFNVCYGRFTETHPQTDPRSPFAQAHRDMEDWERSLPPSLSWSVENYLNLADLNQGRMFLTMHFLIHSAFCVAYQWYLPQLDGSSLFHDTVDTAGWSLLHREPDFIKNAITNALATGANLSHIYHLSAKARQDLQCTWVAAALLSVANTCLWLVYAKDPDHATADAMDRARNYFDLIVTVFVSWQDHWKAARTWVKTLRGMHALYREAYICGVQEEELLGFDDSLQPDSSSEDESTSADYRPTAGDGYPAPTTSPSLFASLRNISIDTTADPGKVRSALMRFAGSWPHDLFQGLVSDPDLTGQEPSGVITHISQAH